MKATATPQYPHTPILFVGLLALAVRLYGLTYHSLWFDEVVSTIWAARPAAEIWRVGLTLVQDKHPPLYYLMLHGWTALFGPGDAAVRSLGALLGALAVFPLYGIGRRLGSRRAGLWAALFLALSPFLAWYSQEARMFMPATTWVLIGLYGLLAIDGGRSARAAVPWLLCAFGFAAALYTYLFTAFMLPVAGAWVILFWWAHHGQTAAARRLMARLTALLTAGLLFLPLAAAAWSVSGAESAPGRTFEGILPALGAMLRIYSIGWPHWPAPWPLVATLAAGLLALVGLVCGSGLVRPSSDHAFETPASLLLAVWPALPILIGGILLARDRTIFAESRYFIFLAPALCLAWGRGVVVAVDGLRFVAAEAHASHAGLPGRAARRKLLYAIPGIAAAVVLLGGTLAALPWDWAPENRREAWREAAAFVAANAGPHDAVLVQADYVHTAFERYFRGPQPVFFPFSGPLSDPGQVDAPLAGLAGYDAVWLIQSHGADLDPSNLIAGWFAARFPQITESYPPGVAIHAWQQLYRTPELPPGVARLDTTMGALRLIGCAYTPPSLASRDELYHPPSGWIHVSTYWTVTKPAGGARSPIVRLVDAGGQVWGERLDRAGDMWHIWPVTRWLPGEIVRADTDVNLNPLAPAGSYRLVVQATGTAAEAACGDVQIER